MLKNKQKAKQFKRNILSGISSLAGWVRVDDSNSGKGNTRILEMFDQKFSEILLNFVNQISPRTMPIFQPQIEDDAKPLYDIIVPRKKIDKLIMAEDTKRELLGIVKLPTLGEKCSKWGVTDFALQITLLFYGLPGTGKTLAAEALAGEIGGIIFKLK